MQFKRRVVGSQVSLLLMFLWFHVGETRIADKKSSFYVALNIKQIKDIMKNTKSVATFPNRK